jgi:hypothetical protein
MKMRTRGSKDKMSQSETVAVRLRLVCIDPPPAQHEGGGTEFGLQDKGQSLMAGKRQEDGSLVYQFSLTARQNPRTGRPNFSGPFVHGTIDAQFLYLSWRSASVERPGWIHRTKVQLGSMTWAQVTKGSVLQARVSAVHSGTASLLGDGWTA